ncbi:MAG: hypothetical protein ACQSGP_10285 [Frankia sp.]
MAGENVPSPAADRRSPGELRARSGKRVLVAVGNVISVDSQTFHLGELDRVVYKAATRINQSSYTIGLAQGETKCTFTFDAYRRGTEMDDTREIWHRLVTVLENTACPRIAQNAAQAIMVGETVVFGSLPATRIDADTEGLRQHKPFAKKVPWNQLAGADLREGQVRVWTGKERATGKNPKLRIDMAGWNAVILPRVVALLTGPRAA